MTGRNIARYMQVERLIRSYKDMLDAGELTLTAAVELFYLSEDEQTIVAALGDKVNEQAVKTIRVATGELTEEKLKAILHLVKVTVQPKAVSVKIPAETEKVFKGKVADRTGYEGFGRMVCWEGCCPCLMRTISNV